MKNIILFIVYVLCMYSCDPTTCYEYIIENRTDKNLKLIKFSSDSLGAKSVIMEIFANDSYTEMNDCIFGSIGGGGFEYQNDSIQIWNNNLLRTYYPSDKGKSIFKTTFLSYGEEATNSWKLVKHKGNHEKYVFEITEEDLK